MSTDNHDVTALLGPIVQEHRTRSSYLWGLLASGGALLAIGLLAAGKAFFALVKDPTSDDVIVSGITAAPFLLAGALLLVLGLFRLPQRACVHQGGLYFRNRKGEWAVPWAMIDGVYQKVLRVYRGDEEIDVRDVYTIDLRDGTRLEVDFHFEAIDAFGAMIAHQLDVLLLPALQQAFRAGQALSFGPVTIDRSGVHTGGKSLSWGEVEAFSWRRGILSSERAFLQIKRTGGLLAWAKVPIEQIKNYSILMALASEVTRVT